MTRRWRPHWARTRGPLEARLKKGDALPDFSLTMSGRATVGVRLISSGQVTAITFVFTRCPVPEFCPLMVKRFQQVQWKLESIRLTTSRPPAQRDTRSGVRYAAGYCAPTPRAWKRTRHDGSSRRDNQTRSPDSHPPSQSMSSAAVRSSSTRWRRRSSAGDGRIEEIWRGNAWSATELFDALRRVAAASDKDETDR